MDLHLESSGAEFKTMTLNQCRWWAGGEAENEPHFSGAEATQPRVSHGGENWIRMSQQGRTAAPEGGGECPHGGEHQPRMSQHRRTPAQDVPTGHCCNPAHFPFWSRVLLPLVCFLEWGLFFFWGCQGCVSRQVQGYPMEFTCSQSILDHPSRTLPGHSWFSTPRG